MSHSLRRFSDDQLLTRFRDLARRGSTLEAELVAHLGEIDRRRLHVREGYPSLYQYCVEALNFSEAVAYLRIEVARRCGEIPQLLDAIRRGDLHLTGARLLARQLTPANARELIAAARGKTKRQIEQLLADRSPRPDRPAEVRRMPVPAPAPSGQPLAAARLAPRRPASGSMGSARAGSRAPARAGEVAAQAPSAPRTLYAAEREFGVEFMDRFRRNPAAGPSPGASRQDSPTAARSGPSYTEMQRGATHPERPRDPRPELPAPSPQSSDPPVSSHSARAH